MTLIEILIEKTQSLKEQYIEMTLNWADGYFNSITERVNWDEEKWAKFLGVKTRTFKNGARDIVTFERGFYGTRDSVTYDRLKREAYRLKNMGKESYKAKEKEYAEKHYKQSIEKLAYRIEKKELNQANLSVKTSHIGVNINTVLTDGEKTVRAWTIIAEGAIQRPHYRYLVK